MRLTSIEVDRLLADKKINPDIARQVKAAELEAKSSAQRRTSTKSKSNNTTKIPKTSSESQGEASLRIALIHAFGDWFAGGEVVSELVPFTDRNYRADFALPRYRIYVEVDGWSHHGKHLNSHHEDRERGLFFSQYDWLPFRASHKQATENPMMVVDAIARVLTMREGCERSAVAIHRVQGKVQTYCRLMPID